MYNLKLGEHNACIYWDSKLDKFFFSSEVLFVYSFATGILNYFSGFYGLESKLYSYEDFELFIYNQRLDWSILFTFTRFYLIKLLKDKQYWINLFFSFLLFLLVFIIMYYFAIAFSKEWEANIFSVRIILFFILGFLFIFIYKTLFNNNKSEWIYDAIFAKILVFFWKFIEDLPLYFSNLFCLFVNLLFCILLFWSYDSLQLFFHTFIIYMLVILILAIVNFIATLLLLKFPDSKFLLFLIKYKMPSIMLAPTGTLILYLFFLIYWWVMFISKSLSGKQWEFLYYYFSNGYLKLMYGKSYPSPVYWYGDPIFSAYHLDKYFWYNDHCSTYIIHLSDDLIQMALEKRKSLKVVNLFKKEEKN